MPDMETPHYHIRRLRIDEYEAEADVPSYDIDLVEDEEEDERKPSQPAPDATEAEKPVIGPLTHTAAPPERPKAAVSGGGIIKKIISGIFGKKPVAEQITAPVAARPARQHPPSRGHGGGRPHHRPSHGQRQERHERHTQSDRRPGGQEQGRARPAQPQQAAGGSGGNAGQAQRERPESGSGRRRRRGRRRGRGQDARPSQDRQNPNARNGEAASNRPPENPAREPRQPQEEMPLVPVTTGAGVAETITGNESTVSSWDKASEHNDGWHTPSADTPERATPQDSDDRKSAPKPELVQVETRFDNDDDKGNK